MGSAGAHRATSDRRRAWAGRAVDGAVAVVLLLALMRMVQLTRDAWFFGDDWKLLLQARTPGGLWEPYNEHLSVIILSTYRALIETVGFTYWPFQLVGLILLVSIPAAYYVTTHAVLSRPVAGLAAVSLLGWAGLELNPAWFNHYLVLLAGIGCGAALRRGDRADLVVAVLLLIALAAAGGGVAVAAACLVHTACTGASLRRWAAVMVPLAAWATWWLLLGRTAPGDDSPRGEPDLVERLEFARDVLYTPYLHLGLHHPLLTGLLVVAFVATGVWAIRRGRRAAASFVAWSAAGAVWALGLAFSRGGRGFLGEVVGVDARYQMVAACFALLAVVPETAIRWPARLRLDTDPRWLAAGAMAVLLTAGGIAWSIQDEVSTRARAIESFTPETRGTAVVLGLGPEVVPADLGLGFRFFWLDAADVRSVLNAYGDPFRTPLEEVDRRLVDDGVAIARVFPPRRVDCEPMTGTIRSSTEPGERLYLWADAPRWTVDVRRFGDSWVRIASPRSGETVALRLPALGSTAEWEVRAEGACETTRPP